MTTNPDNRGERPLFLTGAHVDRSKLTAIRDLLESHGQKAISAPWTKNKGNVSSPLLTSPAPAIIFCWSAASASLDYKKIHALARRLAEQGRYMGISLDGSAAPSGLNAVTVPELTSTLAREGPKAVESLHPIEEYHLDPMRRPVATLRRWKRWILGVPSVLLASWLLSLAFNYVSTIESTCKVSLLREPCRLMPHSGVPSWAEESAWKRIAARRECAAFETYLRSHGPTAPYSADARQRLELSVSVSGARTASFDLHVPDYSQPPRFDRATAEADVMKTASARSRDMCSLRGKNFEGELTEGAFKAAGAPSCAKSEDSWVCSVSGTTECHFKVANASRSCPPHLR